MNNDIETYIKERVDDQIAWHDNKSIDNQKQYKSGTMVISIFSLIIPIISIINIDNPAYLPLKNLIIAILGASISLLSLLLDLNKYHQNWIDYRNTCELLKKEKYFYIFSIGKYEDEQNKDKLFIESVEEMLSKQNSNWTTSVKVPVTSINNNYSSTNS